MDNFKAFDRYDYLILAGIAVIAVGILIYSFIRTNRRRAGIGRNVSKRMGAVQMLSGWMLILVSVIGYISIEKSHTGFFKPVSILGSRPHVLLSLLGLAAGFVLFLSGLHKMRPNKKSGQ